MNTILDLVESLTQKGFTPEQITMILASTGSTPIGTGAEPEAPSAPKAPEAPRTEPAPEAPEAPESTEPKEGAHLTYSGKLAQSSKLLKGSLASLNSRKRTDSTIQTSWPNTRKGAEGAIALAHSLGYSPKVESDDPFSYAVEPAIVGSAPKAPEAPESTPKGKQAIDLNTPEGKRTLKDLLARKANRTEPEAPEAPEANRTEPASLAQLFGTGSTGKESTGKGAEGLFGKYDPSKFPGDKYHGTWRMVEHYYVKYALHPINTPIGTMNTPLNAEDRLTKTPVLSKTLAMCLGVAIIAVALDQGLKIEGAGSMQGAIEAIAESLGFEKINRIKNLSTMCFNDTEAMTLAKHFQVRILA